MRVCVSERVHVMVIQDAFIFQRQSVQMGFLQMRCGGVGGSVGDGQLVVVIVVRWWWWCWLAGGGGRGGVRGWPGRWVLGYLEAALSAMCRC